MIKNTKALVGQNGRHRARVPGLARSSTEGAAPAPEGGSKLPQSIYESDSSRDFLGDPFFPSQAMTTVCSYELCLFQFPPPIYWRSFASDHHSGGRAPYKGKTFSVMDCEGVIGHTIGSPGNPHGSVSPQVSGVLSVCLFVAGLGPIPCFFS
jgi:hypothetical protein